MQMDISTSQNEAQHAEEILQAARQPDAVLPNGWTVIPLNLDAVRRSILGWIGGALVGVVLFALLFVTVHDVLTPISLSSFLLVLLAFIALGSTWLVIKYIRLYGDRSRQLIVMTPNLYVQQRGANITSVPMDAIEHITLRGVFGGDASYTQVNDRDVSHAVMGLGQMLGGSQARRARRTPDSLAFVDTRTDKPVTVAEDNSFTDLAVLEELLRTYVDNARRARKN
jgi:hypothetical protein